MYVFRLGILSFLLSETLVSGFTTAAAIHVLTSQLKDIFGLTLPSIKGNFKLIKTYIELFKLLPEANQVAMLLSAITIIVLIFNNEWLKPRVAKKTILPIPIELIIVVGGTLLSKYTKMEDKWDIIPVGNIPVGLPEFTVPDFSIWKDLIVDSIAIAFVSYSVTVSMALIFGQKLNYEIGFNQELLAMVSHMTIHGHSNDNYNIEIISGCWKYIWIILFVFSIFCIIIKVINSTNCWW